MADYTIYALGENSIKFDDPNAQMDGVTQGTGEHLLGQTFTLTSSLWQPIGISDRNTDFRDNDGGQRLAEDVTFNGVDYDARTRVEPEYGLVVTDGTTTWTLVGFNIHDSNPVFATVEGLAVIASPAGFPPPNVPLTVVSYFEGPDFEAAEYQQPICFAAGTGIETPQGMIAVERLRPGAEVITRDHGVQRVLWTGARKTAGTGDGAPVRIAAGTFGNAADVYLSQEHRVLVSDWCAPYYFGVDDIFVPAKGLTCLAGVDLAPCDAVSYHHLLLETHCALSADGLWSESLLLGPQALKSLSALAQQQLHARFSHLMGTASDYHLARGFEARVLQRAA